MEKYVTGLVSVIIPTYKRCDSLIISINSVLNQTYKNIELIVVNDNTPNDEYSLELYKVINKIQDKRLIFVEQDIHVNGAVARNFGIKVAKGEYISFLDDDDYIMPQKIEHQIRKFEELDESWGVVSCMMARYKCNVLNMAIPPYKSGDLLHPIMQRIIDVGTGTALIRRKALDNVGYFDENLLRHQDVQLFTRLSSKYKIFLLKEYLYVLNVDDAQNRPSVEKIIEIKKAYYNSVSDILENMTTAQKNKIFILNSFEYSALLFKNKKYVEFIKNVLLIFRYPSTLYLAFVRVFKRALGIAFKKQFIKKYGMK